MQRGYQAKYEGFDRSLSLGYGVTAWSSQMKRNHFDGIAVYTQALFQSLSQLIVKEQESVQLLPMGFGDALSTFEGHKPFSLGRSFPQHLALATFLFHKLDTVKQAHSPQVFHATDHHIPVFKKTPVIATVMDIIPLLYPEWASGQYRALKNFAFKRSILSAEHWITISEYSKQDLITHLNLPEERISVIPLGVDERYFQPISDTQKQQVLDVHRLRPGFFLFLGTLQPRKNLTVLLDAHASLPKAYRLEHPLVIVGGQGWKSESLRERVESFAQEGTVRWLNTLPQYDVKVLLQSACALMFISLYEGFGLPILEAFASNCPVIASNTTSIPEVAADAALLVSPTSVDEVREAMLKRIEQPLDFLILQEKGRMRASQFTWERCAKMTLSVYKQVGGKDG